LALTGSVIIAISLTFINMFIIFLLHFIYFLVQTMKSVSTLRTHTQSSYITFHNSKLNLRRNPLMFAVVIEHKIIWNILVFRSSYVNFHVKSERAVVLKDPVSCYDHRQSIVDK
jgi:hypothetical protein